MVETLYRYRIETIILILHANIMHNYQYENVIKIHLARVVFEYHIDILQNIARQLFDSSYFLLKDNTTITIFGNVMHSIATRQLH